MRRPALVGGLRNALKQAMDGLFWSQIKHTVSHYKLAVSQRLSNHLTEKTFEKRYIRERGA